MYDGTVARVRELAQPMGTVAAPQGAFFVLEITKSLPIPPIPRCSRARGVRVLNNEKVTVDGLQIVGVHYGFNTMMTTSARYCDQSRPGSRPGQHPAHSRPRPVQIAEEEGFSLQLSGPHPRRTVFPLYLD